MEKWKEIKGFEDYYLISDKGNVIRKKGTSHLKPKNLKHLFDKDGYARVNLKINGKTNSRFIHRLVAEAFINNPLNKPQVNHINGIKTDNCLSNLEWCTISENRVHAYSTGLQNGLSRRGEKSNFNKLSKSQVKEIKSIYSGDLRGVPLNKRNGRKTLKEISKMYNVTDGCIQSIISNRSWNYD